MPELKARAVDVRSRARSDPTRWADRGLTAALVLVLLAFVVPAAFQWHVHADAFAPLSADWRPRVGVGTLPAVALAVALATRAIEFAHRASWRFLVIGAGTVALTWMLCLAFVDGTAGIGSVFQNRNEALLTARHVGNLSTLLHSFIGRIPAGAPGSWTTHVAGHPPGSLLFFVLLVRLGLGGSLAAGLVVTVIAATTPIAVLATLDRLGARPAARRAAPFLAAGPFAIWSAVSLDAVIAAVLAWSMYALSCAAFSRTRFSLYCWGFVAGLLFGAALLLSYGMAVAVILLGAVLVVTRTWRPVAPTVAGILVVVGGFAVAGFRWWAALPVLRARYAAGIAADRPAGYWIWADFAALLLSAGLVVAPAGALAIRRRRLVMASITSPARTVVVLALAAVATVVVADLTLMSKAEVERIWLPFMPWLLVPVALLPHAWRRRALTGQLVLALALQTLLFTVW